jgi:hypothetical protein
MNKPCCGNNFVRGLERDYFPRAFIWLAIFGLYFTFHLFPGYKLREEISSFVYNVVFLLPLTIFWLIAVVNMFLANFKDPGIIPRGDLTEIEFDKNDQELNLYGNYQELHD